MHFLAIYAYFVLWCVHTSLHRKHHFNDSVKQYFEFNAIFVSCTWNMCVPIVNKHENVVNKYKTDKKAFQRMRTVRCSGRLLGGVWPGGVWCIPACTEADTPPPANNMTETGVKTFPFRNFV